MIKSSGVVEAKAENLWEDYKSTWRVELGTLVSIGKHDAQSPPPLAYT